MTITAPDSRTTDSPEAPPRATVNGRLCSLDGVPANTTALNWLRDIGLTGAKEGCVAFSQWTRRDELGRKIEVVIGYPLSQTLYGAGSRLIRANPQRCAAASTSSATRLFRR